MPVFGQLSTPSLNDRSKVPLQDAISLYQKNIGNRAIIYTAPEYARPGSNAKGHPFFSEENEFAIGSVDFGDVHYPMLNIGYDIFSDKLIIIPVGQAITLQVLNEKVKKFAFNHHHFLRLVKDSLHNTLPATGYYELLLDGSPKLWARHTKKIEYPIKAEDYRDTKASFVRYAKFYVEMNSRFYEINHERHILDLFPKEKNEMRKWIKQSGLSFRSDRGNFLVKLMSAFSKQKP